MRYVFCYIISFPRAQSKTFLQFFRFLSARGAVFGKCEKIPLQFRGIYDKISLFDWYGLRLSFAKRESAGRRLDFGKEDAAVKTGNACKNLTDGLLLLMAIIALVCVIVGVISFDGMYLMSHPVTGEDVYVNQPLENPYYATYLKLALLFGSAAVLGFLTRRWPYISVGASLCTVVASMNYYTDGLIRTYPFVYVLFAVTGLCGSLVYTACFYTERRRTQSEEAKTGKPGKKSKGKGKGKSKGKGTGQKQKSSPA